MTQTTERGAHDAPRRRTRPRRCGPDEYMDNLHIRGPKEAMEWFKSLNAGERGAFIASFQQAAMLEQLINGMTGNGRDAEPKRRA